MLSMWPQSRVPSIDVAFRCTILHSFHSNLTHDLLSIRLGGSGGRIASLRPIAGYRRRSPHDQTEPGFELATFCLER